MFLLKNLEGEMMLSNLEIEEIKKLSKENRQNVVRMVHNANSGHIGGSLSSCDILTVLFNKCMKHSLDKNNLDDYQSRDRFVLSKGHVSPLYYSVLSQVGFVPKDELLTFRKLGSRLQGHPCLVCPGVQVATGSLGQGLSLACGIAISLKLDKNPANVFVLLGDGELQEGSVWEAFMQASHRNLNNIVAIVDKNGLQIDGETDCVKSLGNLSDKIRSFGWNVLEIDGHNISEIYESIENAKKSDSPTAIIAKTIKGKGVSFMENNAGWHGKAPSDEEFELAMTELK